MTVSTIRLRGLAAALILGAFAITAPVSDASAQNRYADMTDDERALFREEVRAFLLDEPEILLEVSAELERRRLEAALAALTDDMENGRHIAEFGSPDGDVLMVEFTDYECRFCREVRPEVDAFLADNPEVRYVVRALPRVGTEIPERAAVAASLQDADKAAALHNAMMTYNGPLDVDAVMALAGDVGLDQTQLFTDMGGDAVTGRLDANDMVSARLGIRGTPGFVIGDIVIPGAIPATEMENVLEEYQASLAE